MTYLGNVDAGFQLVSGLKTGRSAQNPTSTDERGAGSEEGSHLL